MPEHTTALEGILLEQDGPWKEGDREALVGFMFWPADNRRVSDRDMQFRYGLVAGWNAAMDAIAKATGATFHPKPYGERVR